jgi:hypothetical protein
VKEEKYNVDRLDGIIAISLAILCFGVLLTWCESPIGQIENLSLIGNILIFTSAAFLLISVFLYLLKEKRKNLKGLSDKNNKSIS